MSQKSKSNGKHHTESLQLFDLAPNNGVEWRSSTAAGSTASVSKSRSSLRANRLSLNGNRSPSSPAIISTISRLTPEGGNYSLDTKYDCCAFVIYCHKHDRVAVSKRHSAQWLPFTPLPPNKTWDQGAIAGALITLSGGEKKEFLEFKSHMPFQTPQLMDILRLQLPHTQRFMTRLIYLVRLQDGGNKQQHFKCCQQTATLEWLRPDGAEMRHPWGPELVKFVRLAKTIGSPPQHVTEYTLEQALRFVPRDPPQNSPEAILHSVRITEKDVERLYTDYLDHCFPSSYMSAQSFQHYMKTYGFETNEQRIGKLFYAFNRSGSGFLNFHEFLIGLAIMEPSSHSGPLVIKLRAKFIFRYYHIAAAQGHHSHLNIDAVRLMIGDLYPHDSRESLHEKAAKAFQQMSSSSSSSSSKSEITVEQFKHALQGQKNDGLSGLCISSKPIFAQILRAIADRTLTETKQSPSTMMNEVMQDRAHKSDCVRCTKEIRYELAAHVVHLNEIGGVLSSKRVFDHPNASSSSSSTTAVHAKEEATSSKQPPHHSNRIERKHSLECIFNGNHSANQLIEHIRKFAPHKMVNGQPDGVMSREPEKFYTLLKQLCDLSLAPLLKREPKCVSLGAPCYAIGDIHGNLEDLLSLEKAIWRRIPIVSANYMFLGDYVDRGRWGVECAVYLFAFKVLCPANVVLLRGNHEVRELQARYSYKNECTRKYGADYGAKIWELTNAMFDLLPISGVIDRAIFAAHGGIPRSASRIDQINAVQHALSDPQHQSPIAWEILWSDPCHLPMFNDLADVTAENTAEDIESGFIDNVKRGTAFLFNEIAVDTFLAANSLTHIIRAHEVPQCGYTFHFGQKCATIFSCSHYCGNANECATILVDGNTLRVVHLDTVNNSSATD